MRISDWSSDVCSSDLCVNDIGVIAAKTNAVILCQDISHLAAPDDFLNVLPDQRSGSVQRRRGFCNAKLRPNHLGHGRSEEHTSELQSLMRISYAVFCLKKKKLKIPHINQTEVNKSKH